MKISRKQLRKLINESIYGGSNYPARLPNPMDHVSPEVRKKLETLFTHDDPAFQRQGYDLATTLQPDMTVFPNDGDPYTRKPYEGDDYLADLENSDQTRLLQIKLRNAYDAVAAENLYPHQPDVYRYHNRNSGDPDFERKAQLLQDLREVKMAAIDYSKKIAAESGLTRWGYTDIFRQLFYSYIPKDQR